MLFLVIITALAVLFVTKAMRVALAETWGDSGEVDKVRRAVALDPVNPKLHYTLDRLYLLRIEASSPAQAVGEMRWRQPWPRGSSATKELGNTWLGPLESRAEGGDPVSKEQLCWAAKANNFAAS